MKSTNCSKHLSRRCRRSNHVMNCFYGNMGKTFDQSDALAERAPNGFGGVTPKDDGRSADRSSEVRNAGVVADEQRASAKARGQFGQRKGVGEFAGGGFGEAFEAALFGFAADEQQARAGKLLDEFAPVRFGPILLFAAAARMQSDHRLPVSRRQLEMRDGIGIKDRKALQRFEEHLCRMDVRAFVRPVRAGEELRFGDASDIFLKNAVRVVQIRNNYGKRGEKVGERRIELPA